MMSRTVRSPRLQQVLDVVDRHAGALLAVRAEQEQDGRHGGAHAPHQGPGDKREQLHHGSGQPGERLGAAQGQPLRHELPEEQRHE
jgi:hypothetical protein